MLFRCDDSETKPGIVGTWQCEQLIWENCNNENFDKNDSCYVQKYTFKEDGTLLFESSIGVGEGAYDLNNNLLSITIGIQTSENIVIAISGDTMTTVFHDSTSSCDERNILIRQ